MKPATVEYAVEKHGFTRFEDRGYVDAERVFGGRIQLSLHDEDGLVVMNLDDPYQSVRLGGGYEKPPITEAQLDACVAAFLTLDAAE